MEYSKLSLKELKDIIFNHEFKRFPYLNNFKKNPYTYLKARYYMYGSTLLLFFLFKSPIKPNDYNNMDSLVLWEVFYYRRIYI